MTRPRALFALLIVFAVALRLQPQAAPQVPTPPPKRPPEELLRLSLAAETPGLAQPFRGITSNGTLETGLFAIRSTGVSTESVRTAATTFLAALTPAQRSSTTFAVDDAEWRKWMNQSF